MSRRSRTTAPLAALLLAGALALAGCGDDGDSGSGGSGSARDLDTADLQTVPAGQGTACDYPSAGDASREVNTPPAEMTVTGQVPVTLQTTQGDFGLTLDADAAPCTVNSFLSLAQQGYFDDTTCQRFTTPDTSGTGILQCGDPTGTGRGGPGYSFADELGSVDQSDPYPAGTLAMANAGPDTNGSQFFIVYADSAFPPAYTVFGTVDQATIDALTALADKGVEDQGAFTAPVDPVDIEKVTVG